MISTIEEFVEEFNKIKAMGWIKTHRAGPTGIGKTLEDLLGIEENNLDRPDFGSYELKSKRLNNNSMLTIFTKTPQPSRANLYLLNKYGYQSDAYDNGRKVLHTTLTAQRFVPISDTGYSLKIKCGPEKIWIASSDQDENVYWDKEKLKKAFERKYKGEFVYAYADSRTVNGTEEFLFKEAYIVSGFSYEDFVQLLEEGKIKIDFRMGQYHGGENNGRLHDHGTAFRINESDEKYLFKVKKKIA